MVLRGRHPCFYRRINWCTKDSAQGCSVSKWQTRGLNPALRSDPSVLGICFGNLKTMLWPDSSRGGRIEAVTIGKYLSVVSALYQASFLLNSRPLTFLQVLPVIVVNSQTHACSMSFTCTQGNKQRTKPNYNPDCEWRAGLTVIFPSRGPDWLSYSHPELCSKCTSNLCPTQQKLELL